MIRSGIALIMLLLLVSVSLQTGVASPSALQGTWKLVPEKSSEIDLYGTVSLTITLDGKRAEIAQVWGGARGFKDTLRLDIGGKPVDVAIKDRVWPTNAFMGISLQPGTTKQVSGTQKDGILTLEERYTLRGSQGKASMNVRQTFALADDGRLLVWKLFRSTRGKGQELTYTFSRNEIKPAYFMRLPENWEIGGKLPSQAFLISLQGLANTDAPRLYFIYPEKWDYLFTPSVFNYYKTKRGFAFNELKSVEEAFATLKSYVKGYVVWDPAVRTSLVVAFTVAGLERAVVVTEDLIPMMQKEGLRPVADFRGKFTGKTDLEIYSWAYNQYWDRCSRDFVVWMGGESGKVMKPGVADFGIQRKAFFTDLSTKTSDTAEYALASKIMSEMKPMSLVMGWHSYAKDKERDYVTLASHYTLRVEGLHTLPNASFSSLVPASPGFKFKNNHNVVPGKTYEPGKKVYIACVQTDCLGLGAWEKPGRGDIPYAWEVTMNWSWLMPAMLEYFYTMATPNDYFVGSLSGPGYMYPKAIPPESLDKVIAKAKELMDQLDLNVFETMDYSEGATVEGNTDLPKNIVDAYYRGMPQALGFINGYAPSYTFAVKDGRPFMSFDYYLSETRPEPEAVADLQELAAINARRPYFLLLHVREWSDIVRVKSILGKLGPEFEVVPLDVFLKLAGTHPTFEERFLAK